MKKEIWKRYVVASHNYGCLLRFNKSGLCTRVIMSHAKSDPENSTGIKRTKDARPFDIAWHWTGGGDRWIEKRQGSRQ